MFIFQSRRLCGLILLHIQDDGIFSSYYTHQKVFIKENTSLTLSLTSWKQKGTICEVMVLRCNVLAVLIISKIRIISLKNNPEMVVNEINRRHVI